MLDLPATNAVSERSFGALKRVKTYLRLTTYDNRLNHLMMLLIHKEKTESLNIPKISNEFIERKEANNKMFGQLKQN